MAGARSVCLVTLAGSVFVSALFQGVDSLCQLIGSRFFRMHGAVS